MAAALGIPDYGGARTPARARERVLALFAAPANVAYLRGVFARVVPAGPLRDHAVADLPDALAAFGRSYGPAGDLADSDPAAQRGGARPAVGFVAELRRLNLAFVTNRLRTLRDLAPTITGRSDDGKWDDSEPYHVRMFAADSLRPPGCEGLNGPGPAWEILEGQVARAETTPGFLPPKPGGCRAAGVPAPRYPPGAPYGDVTHARPPPVDGFAPRPWRFSEGGARGGDTPPHSTQGGAPPCGARILPTTASAEAASRGRPGLALGGAAEYSADFDDDYPWSAGDPDRTPEQAIAAYWGEGRAGATALSSAALTGGLPTEGQLYAEGAGWWARGGTRFMRYPEIPFWQDLSARPYERDIDETLGTAPRELDSQVRRWGLDRVARPRGMDTRRHGWRVED